MILISLKKIRIFLIFNILFGYIFLSGHAASANAIVSNIRLSNEQKQLEIIIDKRSEFRPFIADNPIRLIVDIEDAKSSDFKVIDDKIKIVKSAKISKYSKNNQEYLRIILNLDRKVTIDNSRFQKIKNENLGKIIVTLDGDFKKKISGQRKKIIIERDKDYASSDVAEDKEVDHELKNDGAIKAAAEDDLSKLVAKVTEDDSNPYLDSLVQDQQKLIKESQINVKTSKIVLADGSTKYLVKKYLAKEDDGARHDGSTNSLAIIKKKQIPVIVIDPGHGGKDPGAIGQYARSKEKNITLAYAKELKIALDKTKKYKVYLTRNKDIFIPLGRRVEMARKAKADLFISLHANSASNKKVYGLSIYTLSETSSDKQAELLAQKENRADIIAGANFSGASPDIMKTLINLSQRDSMNNSAIFANLAIKLVKNFDIEILNNTHRFAGFRVLTAPDMVSVLIELGYLSNKSEEKKLNDFKYRKKLAAGLVVSIDSYFGQRR